MRTIDQVAAYIREHLTMIQLTKRLSELGGRRRTTMRNEPAREVIPASLTVFQHQGQLVADSRDVAELIGRPHYIVLRTIRTMYKHLGDNNFVCSDYFIEAAYISEQGKEQPCYYCTEMGCDMVANKMTGERGTVFTARYVQAFHLMKEELTRRRELRTIGKPIRRSLTDALRDSGEVERMKGHAYSAYTNLAYKLTTGKNARQLRRERGAAKETRAVDILTAAELEVYQRKEAALAVLLDAGMIYDTIKTVLANGVN